MNFRYVSKLLGMLIAFASATMIFSIPWSLLAGETGMVLAFVKSMVIGVAVGGALFAWGRKITDEFFRREGLAVVSLGWILVAAVGALPFWFCPAFAADAGGFVDAYFESMSGFTTTGSTVITNIEGMPQGLLFWRSFTQWLGGMGIVVLFVAVLPAMGIEAKHLYKVEVPGIKKEGGAPRIKDAAGLLWKVYLGLSVAEAVLLKLAGMTWYEALNHTFTTMATGGFSTRNASVAGFDSLAIEIIIIIFMLLVGVNFSLFVGALRGRARDMLRDVELRTYLIIIAAVTLALTASLMVGGIYDSYGRSFRDSLFQAVSIVTTTGYCTADFDEWTPFARMTLVALMFVGGCAGSTGGSMKVIRVLVVAKAGALEIEKFFFPKMVKQVKVGGTTLPDATMRAVLGFSALFIGVWAFGSLFMAVLGMDLETAASSVIACLGNIGPGLAKVGAVENFGWISAPGKIFLSFCMVMGRLELFTVLVLFVPSFWKE